MKESKNREPLLVFLPVEWLVAKGVSGVSHLDNSELSVDIVTRSFHDQMQDAVGKVVFNPIFAELFVVFSGHFTDKE